MNTDVIIVGAGPVGLLLGNLLGQLNINTLIIEKKKSREIYSKAIGIMPPALEIINRLQLKNRFIQSGVKVNKAVIHGTKKILGCITFKSLPDDDFILSIPQIKTEQILEENLKLYPAVTLLYETEAVKLIHEPALLKLICRSIDKEIELNGQYVIGCDGGKSTVRNLLKIPYYGNKYRATFLMGDFIDHSDLKNEAHLFFTRYGAVESFPLPDNKRRWIIQTTHFLQVIPDHFLENEVLKRSGYQLESSHKIKETPFGVQHYLIAEYYKNMNIMFCGDAAHIMSPIGGQGMNTGFADAELLAAILTYFLKGKIDDKSKTNLLKQYEYFRKTAFITAKNRAFLSMSIGTIKGFILSLLRNILIYVILRTPVIKRIPFHFSMLTIPYVNLNHLRRNSKLFAEINDINDSGK